jgi:GNAT superfamily N-acetyltransferase
LGEAAGHRLSIRAGQPCDAPRLTAIAHAAKRYWGYAEELIALWDDELTLTPEFIASHPVFCALRDDEIAGFYALSCQENACELEHMWVEPAHIGTGVGACLFEHALQTVQSLGRPALTIVSDPHAEGFYRRMGARRAGQVPSQPAGRVLPRLTYAVALDRAPGLPEEPWARQGPLQVHEESGIE